eukprot:TRINITY_DN14595_c2_g4_i1.p1 TRINITY_DN14595_c2_g4~~TRINITY_DN14595_c2_g4_i1.p1  ORF type:complete len:1302 (-),score=284.36 TRINITY_DN14595_c2_g4_i1:71-3976(-)
MGANVGCVLCSKQDEAVLAPLECSAAKPQEYSSSSRGGRSSPSKRGYSTAGAEHAEPGSAIPEPAAASRRAATATPGLRFCEPSSQSRQRSRDMCGCTRVEQAELAQGAFSDLSKSAAQNQDNGHDSSRGGYQTACSRSESLLAQAAAEAVRDQAAPPDTAINLDLRELRKMGADLTIDADMPTSPSSAVFRSRSLSSSPKRRPLIGDRRHSNKHSGTTVSTVWASSVTSDDLLEDHSLGVDRPSQSQGLSPERDGGFPQLAVGATWDGDVGEWSPLRSSTRKLQARSNCGPLTSPTCCNTSHPSPGMQSLNGVALSPDRKGYRLSAAGVNFISKATGQTFDLPTGGGLPEEHRSWRRMSNTSSTASGSSSMAESLRRHSLSSCDWSVALSESDDDAMDDGAVLSPTWRMPATPATFLRPRKGGVCAGSVEKRVLSLQTVPKDKETCDSIMEALQNSVLFSQLKDAEVEAVVATVDVETIEDGEQIVQMGDSGDILYLVLDGCVDCYIEAEEALGTASRSMKPSFHEDPNFIGQSAIYGKTYVCSREAGSIVGELSIMFNTPRSLSVYANGQCKLGLLDRQAYQSLVVHSQIRRREQCEECLRRVKLLETLSDEQIAQLGDAIKMRSYGPGEAIIRQGQEGHEFFIVQSGECVATVKTHDDVQEVRRYHSGDLFGELALLRNAKRAASVVAVDNVECMVLSRQRFERMLGPLEQMQQRTYQKDPRKLVADFYGKGDHRGPAGSLELLKESLAPEPGEQPTSWFAVFRPTSRHAIAKMLGGQAVGKGLNVKGKSAKKNRLSGFVPFVQISNNDHKDLIEPIPDGSRILIFFKTQAARSEALMQFSQMIRDVRDDGESNTPEPCSPTSARSPRSPCSPISLARSVSGLSRTSASASLGSWRTSMSNVSMGLGDSCVYMDDTYANTSPPTFGLSVPGPVVQLAYITKPDLSPLVDWDTGRQSEPAFMDMNVHAVLGESEPRAVLYQSDEGNPLNPRGLLIAYAEGTVKPVVSDFDAFLIGSRGMQYETLPEQQQKLVLWTLKMTEHILSTPTEATWTTRWLQGLKREAAAGFDPAIPKFGFGDPTSYRLMSDVIERTSACGAVRHGAECFNFYFPQELDDEYLIIWEGFPDKPWEYKTESELRRFLIDRVAEDFCFPLNPVWPLRDAKWFEVLEALRSNEATRRSLDAWYPPESGIPQRMDMIHKAHPRGFSNLAADFVRRTSSDRSGSSVPLKTRSGRAMRRLSDVWRKRNSLSDAERMDVLTKDIADEHKKRSLYTKVVGYLQLKCFRSAVSFRKSGRRQRT